MNLILLPYVAGYSPYTFTAPSVSVRFNLTGNTLTVSKRGTGSGTASCTVTMSAAKDARATFNLQAAQ